MARDLHPTIASRLGDESQRYTSGRRRVVEVLTSAGRPLTAAAAGGEPWPVYRTDYTPWPSALRITATFHDNRDAIEGGRLVQFTSSWKLA